MTFRHRKVNRLGGRGFPKLTFHNFVFETFYSQGALGRLTFFFNFRFPKLTFHNFVFETFFSQGALGRRNEVASELETSPQTGNMRILRRASSEESYAVPRELRLYAWLRRDCGHIQPQSLNR